MRKHTAKKLVILKLTFIFIFLVISGCYKRCGHPNKLNICLEIADYNYYRYLLEEQTRKEMVTHCGEKYSE